MTTNIDLLKRTLAHIEAHPEEWDQLEWHCGTAACFAGHASILAGAKWADENDGDDRLSLITPTGDVTWPWEFAQQSLSISDREADALFAADNSLDDLRRIVGELTGGAA